MTVSVEICADNLPDAIAAADAGADRIELCTSLSEGGLTPSYGLMVAAAKLPVPVHSMIRPRGGGFHYTTDEAEIMHEDIRAARQAGLDGVVFGATRKDNTLETDLLRNLIDTAGSMSVTLHRAFDVTPDPFAALDTAVSLGISRILTSGQAQSAVKNPGLIARLVAKAAGRIIIMPGAGINEQNASVLIRATGVPEIHASCSERVISPDRFSRFGFEPAEGRIRSSPGAIRALCQAVRPPAG